jgi:hypothetical protein
MRCRGCWNPAGHSCKRAEPVSSAEQPQVQRGLGHAAEHAWLRSQVVRPRPPQPQPPNPHTNTHTHTHHNRGCRPTAVPCTACRGCGRRWGLGGAVPPCVLVLVEGGGWARALLNHASIAARHEHLRSARHPAPSRLRLPGKLRAVSPCVVPQAREQLHVVTVVCANRSYSILRVELAKQRIAPRCDDRRPACEPRAS